jgi:hypothetical protein
MTTLPLNLNAKHQDIRMCEYILIIVSKYLNVDDNFHTTKNRKSELVFARQMAMLMMKRYTKLSLEQIGSCFERDHATVLHGIRHIQELSDSDKMVKKQIYDIDQIMRYKSKALVNKIDLNRDYYYLDFDDFVSVRFTSTKGIMFTGFDDEEIKELLQYIPIKYQVRTHDKTGMYILEPKKLPDNERTDIQQ